MPAPRKGAAPTAPTGKGGLCQGDRILIEYRFKLIMPYTAELSDPEVIGPYRKEFA